MKALLNGHFPANKSRWKIYFRLYLPMFIGSTLFALNGFVDNFMVGHINQGGTALAAVNSWTSIIFGIFMGISASASTVMAKYYFSGDFERAKSLYKLRIALSLGVAFIFFAVALSSPDLLIKVFLKEPTGSALNKYSLADYNTALSKARTYLRIVVFQWVLVALTHSQGNALREIGHSKASMYWGMGTFVTNIALNSILMYGFNFDVDGAAYATVAARMFALIFGLCWIYFKKIKIAFNPLYIFKIHPDVIKDFLRKWYLVISVSATIFFITIRNFFYDAGFKVTSLAPGVGAMSVLALTGAIVNVFTTTFSSLGSLSALTVGKELSLGKEERAFEVGKELKGFILSFAIFMSVLLAITASLVPYMHFLSENKVAHYEGKRFISEFDGDANLLQVRNSLWTIAVAYPMWIWFSASYKQAVLAKKGFWFAFVDIFSSSVIQISWLAIIIFAIVPHVPYMQHNFWATYALFFSSDIIKLIWFELLYYKTKWNVTISKEKNKENQLSGIDEQEQFLPE
ncbi:MAG: MATE family efflux transporter [Mycoplasmataceae bacterium]|nr:MATE family efflux transporter [Mycoplasmataceae bacterium]